MLVRPARRATKRGAEERPSSVGDRRQGDQRLEPVEERAGGIAHAGRVAGPDRDRQQHDVAGREPGHGEAAQQFALGRGRPAPAAGRGRTARRYSRAPPPPAPAGCRARARPASAMRQPARGQVHPRRLQPALRARGRARSGGRRRRNGHPRPCRCSTLVPARAPPAHERGDVERSVATSSWSRIRRRQRAARPPSLSAASPAGRARTGRRHAESSSCTFQTPGQRQLEPRPVGPGAPPAQGEA